VSNLGIYEGMLLNTHIHEGDYPASVGAVKYDFLKQRVTNGEISVTIQLPISFKISKDSTGCLYYISRIMLLI
jgi:hypothetical protein